MAGHRPHTPKCPCVLDEMMTDEDRSIEGVGAGGKRPTPKSCPAR